MWASFHDFNRFLEPWLGRVKLVTAIGWMFSLNIAISNLTRYLYDEYDFKYPIYVTFLHMLFSGFACFIYRLLILNKTNRCTLNTWYLSLAFSLSVAFGNLSIAHIFPSFAQMLGSATPLFVLLLNCLIGNFDHHSFHLRHFCAVLIITAGLVLCSYGEINFDGRGFVYASLATIFRAAKAVLQKVLVSSAVHPVVLLEHMAWQSAVLLLPVSLVLENSATLSAAASAVPLVLNCLVACLLNLANFSVATLLNPVTQQLLGNVKTAFGIGASAVLFGNAVSSMQVTGCILTLVGVSLYSSK